MPSIGYGAGMIWFLIIQSFMAENRTVTQAGPFASEVECTTAGEQVTKKFAGNVRFVCTQSTAKAAG